jgi:D-alanyl-D-alanine carboxypeptidase (penicillin-binding protein 5/6)
VVYDKPVPAPIKQGDEVGKLVVAVPDTPPIERPLYAAANVPPIGTFGRMATLAAYLIWGNHR